MNAPVQGFFLQGLIYPTDRLLVVGVASGM
jgi:hypothetical protein